MANSIYLGGGIKSAFCGGNVKEIWQGTNKLFPSSGGEEGLIYKTDFSNFDLTTFVDLPQEGLSTQWVKTRNTISKKKILIDGVEREGLFIQGGLMHTTSDFNNSLPDIFTIETTSYKDLWQGLGMGLMIFGIRCPFYSCYTSSRGLGALCNWGATKLYNQASTMYANAYTGDWYNKKTMNKIRTCGVTVDFVNNEIKAYIEGKKLLSIKHAPLPKTDTDAIRFWGDSGNENNFVCFDLKIYERDKFEEMEG